MQITNAAVEHEVPKDTYYVWDRMVRLTHLINFIAVTVLVLSGLAIGGLVPRPSADEPFFANNMAIARSIHALAAWTFLANGFVRLWWFFAGNTYREWFRFRPWQPNFWREVIWKTRDYATLTYLDRESHTNYHNALASLTYALTFLFGAVMIITGFAMRGLVDPDSMSQAMFGWVIPLLGSEAAVRTVHRLGMWLFLAFMFFHIPFVFMLDILRERNMVSSMINGFKMRPKGWKPTEKPWTKGR